MFLPLVALELMIFYQGNRKVTDAPGLTLKFSVYLTPELCAQDIQLEALIRPEGVTFPQKSHLSTSLVLVG